MAIITSILSVLVLLLLYTTLYFRKRSRQHWLLAYDYMFLYNIQKKKYNITEPIVYDDAFRSYLMKYYKISGKSLIHRESELILDIRQHQSIFVENNKSVK